MKRLACAVCTIVAIYSTPITAIEISPYGGYFRYSWFVESDAHLGNPGTFYETDESTATVQYRSWYDPAAKDKYSGGVVSPISGKTYDTSPILFQQRDGTFDTAATFNESWVHSDAGVGINEAVGTTAYGIGITSSSDAVAHHALDSYLFGSTGEAFASASAMVATFIDVGTAPGEADTFTLNGSYLQNVSADVLVSTGEPDFGSFVTLDVSMNLLNSTTGETLYSYYYEGSLERWSNKNGVFTLPGLSAKDEYWLEMTVNTDAVAQSSSEFVLDDPSCSPDVEICFGEWFYSDEDSVVSTGLDFNFQVEASYVPVPPALWLFGTGLLGLIGIAKNSWRRP